MDDLVQRLRAEIVRTVQLDVMHQDAADRIERQAARNAELERENAELRRDAERINWIETTVKRGGRLDIAVSLFGRGFEIGEYAPSNATVASGPLRKVIDAAAAAEIGKAMT